MKKIYKLLIAMSMLFLIPIPVSAEEDCTFYPAISNICELEMGPVLKLNGKTIILTGSLKILKKQFLTSIM